MPALSLFTDFFTHTTGPAYLTDPSSVINDAQLRNFSGLSAFYRTKKELQGGSSIKDMILLDDPGTASTYQPGDTASVSNIQGGTTIDVPWRFIRVPITWTEAEILLNQGGSTTTSSGQFQQFKKLKDFKYQQAFTSLMNFCERKVVAAADNASMETATGTAPYSMFASITDDGLAPTGFTTVQGVNPTTKTKWRNQTATYTAATPFDADVGLVAGFDTISQLVVFKRPPNSQEYFSADDFRRQVIFTDREGRRDYMKALRANNDITRSGPQDEAYGSPVFNNIPIVANEGFDDRTAFVSGSPDFLFINASHLKMIFHKDKFMQRGDPMTFADKPDTKVVWIDTYCNLFNASRQRHGYLTTV